MILGPITLGCACPITSNVDEKLISYWGHETIRIVTAISTTIMLKTSMTSTRSGRLQEGLGHARSGWGQGSSDADNRIRHTPFKIE